MNVKLLIDGIVRQTTVLIAQLSTAAGLRAPLTHVADEVFVSLAREIEAQGVGRKVVADMFGLALRTYQLKVQRLEASTTVRDSTLWEAVLRFVTERGTATRNEVAGHFGRDGEANVVAVLGDLVASGLLHASGRGRRSVYGVTSDAERRELAHQDDADAIAGMLWATACENPGSTVRTLAATLKLDEGAVREGVERLVAEGRLSRGGTSDDAPLSSAPLLVPMGSELGWEIAVYDHFRAVASGIAAKVRSGRSRSAPDDRIGGATYSFDVTSGHPFEERVYGLLGRIRQDVAALWDEIEAYNREHPIREGKRTVWFYLGQNVEEDAHGERGPADEREGGSDL